MLHSFDVSMAGINAKNFKNDPLVSSERVKFLAISTGFEAIKTLQKDMDKLQTKLTVSVKSAQAADNVSKTAGANKADESKNLCESLAKKDH